MPRHLTEDGRFRSDKHPELPPGKIILSFDDPLAWLPLRIYATHCTSLELAEDIWSAVDAAQARNPDVSPWFPHEE